MACQKGPGSRNQFLKIEFKPVTIFMAPIGGLVQLLLLLVINNTFGFLTILKCTVQLTLK